MGRISFFMNVSLDGFFEGPNHELDWTLVDEETHSHFNEVLAGVSAFLDGRVTHELMAAYWPAVAQDPGATPVEVEFGRIWTEMPKLVYSRTLPAGAAAWNSTVVPEVVASEIRALAEEGDLVVGGPNLAHTFRQLDLIDEYRLYIHPVILGRGNRLFQPGDRPTPLKLAETRRFNSGVIMLRYKRGEA